MIFTLELWCNRKNQTKQYKTKQSKKKTKKKTSERSEQVSFFLLYRISTVWYPISYILRFFSQWPTNFNDWKPLVALHCGVLSFLLLTEQTSYNLSSFRLEIRRSKFNPMCDKNVIKHFHEQPMKLVAPHPKIQFAFPVHPLVLYQKLWRSLCILIVVVVFSTHQAIRKYGSAWCIEGM